MQEASSHSGGRVGALFARNLMVMALSLDLAGKPRSSGQSSRVVLFRVSSSLGSLSALLKLRSAFVPAVWS